MGRVQYFSNFKILISSRDGGSIEGQFEENKCKGKGTYVSPSGERIQAECKKGTHWEWIRHGELNHNLLLT